MAQRGWDGEKKRIPFSGRSDQSSSEQPELSEQVMAGGLAKGPSMQKSRSKCQKHRGFLYAAVVMK